jgi:hypothetical protein
MEHGDRAPWLQDGFGASCAGRGWKPLLRGKARRARRWILRNEAEILQRVDAALVTGIAHPEGCSYDREPRVVGVSRSSGEHKHQMACHSRWGRCTMPPHLEHWDV